MRFQEEQNPLPNMLIIMGRWSLANVETAASAQEIDDLPTPTLFWPFSEDSNNESTSSAQVPNLDLFAFGADTQCKKPNLTWICVTTREWKHLVTHVINDVKSMLSSVVDTYERDLIDGGDEYKYNWFYDEIPTKLLQHLSAQDSILPRAKSVIFRNAAHEWCAFENELYDDVAYRRDQRECLRRQQNWYEMARMDARRSQYLKETLSKYDGWVRSERESRNLQPGASMISPWTMVDVEVVKQPVPDGGDGNVTGEK